MTNMPRWKKNETEFTVRVNADRHVRVCRIPKPVIEMLGDPDSITFHMSGNGIAVRAGE